MNERLTPTKGDRSSFGPWTVEAKEAMVATGWPSLAGPTIAPGETPAALAADRSAYEDFDPGAGGRREVNVERLDQLALEHVLGAR
ncbi:MAG: hypothetical protein ACRDZX_16855 [Acidimicrobiales bacterium]